MLVQVKAGFGPQDIKLKTVITAIYLFTSVLFSLSPKAFAQEKIIPPNQIRHTSAPTISPMKDSSVEQELGYYMSNAKKRVYRNWKHAQIKVPTKTIALFSIDRQGKLVSQSILTPSGYEKADSAALEAIKNSDPFLPLPDSFKGEQLEIKYIFDTHKPKINSDSDWALRGCYSQSSTATGEKSPTISSLVVSSRSDTLHEGDILSVSLISMPSSKASFRIVNYTRGITLQEISPGHYEGKLEIGRTGKLESEAEVCVTNGEKIATLILSKPIKIDTPEAFDAHLIFNDRPLDKTDFPIRVYIDPMARNLEAADAPEEPLPENKRLWLRQGVLDWIRMVLLSPEKDAPKAYIQVLKTQAEEKQEKELLSTNIFSFVDSRSKADLVIEGVNQNYLTDDALEKDGALGIFTQEKGLRVGKITITLKHFQNEGPEEFYFRPVLIHEIGHALGLVHVSQKERCNFMSPAAYECYAPNPEACRKDSETTRCIGVSFAYMKFVESLFLAAPGKGAKSPLLLIREYADGLEKRIQANLQASDILKSAGRIIVQINSDGNLEKLEIVESFGSPELDEKVLQRVRTLAPFGQPPEAWREPNNAFYVDLVPKGLDKKS